ncbi:MAG: Wzz/FepE/Etk N-terminal domain-containing protein [Cytophagales bacterium]|nr:Wzz/FepE/Etk N-terminal domain-containing protein [Cytophagales bacterium]
MEENYRVLKPFLRGFPLIVAAVVLSVLIAKKYLRYTTPLYESTAKIKLADISEGIPSSNLYKDFDVFTTSNKIAAEIEVLRSDVLLEKTFDALDFDVEVYRIGKIKTMELYRNSPVLISGKLSHPSAYDVRYRLNVVTDNDFELILPGTEEAITGSFGIPVKLQIGEILVALNEDLIAQKKHVALVDQYEFEFLSRQKLTGKIKTDLDVISVDKDVAVIRISLRSAVPEKASCFVNKLAETYVIDYIETKHKAAEMTMNFLESQIEEVAGRLASTEASIETYRDDKNIINIRQETETDLRKISQLKIQQTNVKMNLAAIGKLHEYVLSNKDSFLLLAPNFEAFNDLLSTEIVKNIKHLQAEKRDLLLTFTPEEERVKVIDRKIEDLKTYLIESIGNTKKNLEIKYDELSRDIDRAEKAFIGVPGKEKTLTIMNREFEIYQQSYNFLNEKKIEAEIAQAAKIAFHRILAPAMPSKTPVSPNRPIILIVSGILGMFGAIALIYLVHLAKAKVNDVYTIERNSSIPVAVLTPMLKTAGSIERHFLREAIQLELKGLLKDGSVLVLSSNGCCEGRRFHIYHLARALSLQGREVLLLDIEGSLAKMSEGFSEEISDTVIEGVSYLSFNTYDNRLLTKKALSVILEKFRRKFDTIIVNNQPLERETIGLLMMGAADANLIVADARRTPAKQIEQMELLKVEFRLPNLWFVLNRVGYNPNVIREIATWLKNTVRQLKSGTSTNA